MKYSEDDYINNFLNIKNKLGYVPLYNEFEENTKIPIESYSYRFKLKGKVYDPIVRMCVSDSEYEEYEINRLKHKSKIGKKTGALSVQHSFEELEVEFKRVFDYYKNKYNEYPSRRLFSQVSKFHDRTYRKRLNLSWTQICNYYGYTISSKNKHEKICLGIVSEVLNCSYIPQKTWSWLIGVGGGTMYCDGYFEEYNLVVEFDGSQHRKVNSKYGIKSFQRTQANDKLKEDLFKSHNINLLRIDSREKWFDIEYIKNKIINLNLSQLKSA